MEATPLRVQTRFERFPASIKGAFVMRGWDGDPHRIRIAGAVVARVPAGPEWPVPVEDRFLDVAPTRDLFVPFEVPVAELDPAWYSIRSTVQVDGGRTWDFEGRPFTMPWPRSDIRKGSIAVGRTVRAGRTDVVVDRVDLGWDAAVVWWREEGAAEAVPEDDPKSGQALLVTDGQPLEVLPPGTGAKPGEARLPGQRRTASYPVAKSCRSLAVVVRLPTGNVAAPLPLRLR